jgi:hypothetical protein
MSGGRWGPLFDRLVFSKVRARVGGEVKYMTTGEWGGGVCGWGWVGGWEGGGGGRERSST